MKCKNNMNISRRTIKKSKINYVYLKKIDDEKYGRPRKRWSDNLPDD